MGHNAEWLVKRLYPGERAFLWAHNGHVGVGLEAWPSMGTYLRNRLGSAYFAIGQTFDRGGVSLARFPSITLPPSSGNDSEVILRQPGTSPFFLDLRSIPRASPLGQWLSQPHGIKEIGAVSNLAQAQGGEAEVDLRRAFDALTFVAVGHAAHSFELPVERYIAIPSSAPDWMRMASWTLHSRLAGHAAAGMAGDGAAALYVTASPEESRLGARLEATFPAASYHGKAVQLNGALATVGVAGGSSVMVEAQPNGNSSPLSYARWPKNTMAGTNPPSQFSVTLNVPPQAQSIVIDVVLYGAGTVWLSDMSLRTVPATPTAPPGY
jgi:hypothetical protein